MKLLFSPSGCIGVWALCVVGHLNILPPCWAAWTWQQGHQPTEGHCGMNGLQVSSANREEEAARAHQRLLCLLTLNVLVTERSILWEELSHHCDIVQRQWQVLVATVSPCYEVCLADRKSAGFWWCTKNSPAADVAATMLRAISAQQGHTIV